MDNIWLFFRMVELYFCLFMHMFDVLHHTFLNFNIISDMNTGVYNSILHILFYCVHHLLNKLGLLLLPFEDDLGNGGLNARAPETLVAFRLLHQIKLIFDIDLLVLCIVT